MDDNDRPRESLLHRTTIGLFGSVVDALASRIYWQRTPLALSRQHRKTENQKLQVEEYLERNAQSNCNVKGLSSVLKRSIGNWTTQIRRILKRWNAIPSIAKAFWLATNYEWQVELDLESLPVSSSASFFQVSIWISSHNRAYSSLMELCVGSQVGSAPRKKRAMKLW